MPGDIIYCLTHFDPVPAREPGDRSINSQTTARLDNATWPWPLLATPVTLPSDSVNQLFVHNSKFLIIIVICFTYKHTYIQNINIYIYIYIHIHIHTHICTYIHIYIHKHHIYISYDTTVCDHLLLAWMSLFDQFQVIIWTTVNASMGECRYDATPMR